MDLTKVNLNLIPVCRIAENHAPKLEQIIKPETDNIRQFRFIPRPHPPISKRNITKLLLSAKSR